jgi:hypothetical protein
VGQERDCTLRLGGRSIPGRAQLETDYILFRGAAENKGERLKVVFGDLTGVNAQDGILTLGFPGGPAAFELGPQAVKWRDKILNPPTLLDKLGVKPGLSIAIEGDFAFDPGFLAGHFAAKGKADIVFYAAATRRDLDRVARLKSRLAPKGCIWIVYPKGVPAIREVEVIEAGRSAGLKDTKVARFSETHTALRFSQGS